MKRRKRVVAHVLTPRLQGVAHKVTLLIIVDGFTANGRQHNAEDDEHRQPDLAHKCRVVGDFVQQTGKEAPTHGAEVTGALNLV